VGGLGYFKELKGGQGKGGVSPRTVVRGWFWSETGRLNKEFGLFGNEALHEEGDKAGKGPGGG